MLELRDVDLPTIADDQVLLRVHAASVNPVEWYGVTGPYFVRAFGGGLRTPKDTTVGGDVAGRVEAVGKDVKDFQPGDEVFGTSGASWAEYAPAREARLARKPANVSFEEAAAVPVAALTALQALRDKGQASPAEGADQWRLRRRRHLRRPARQGARGGRDRRLQHWNVGPRQVARCRPGRRLQKGGLHAARRASRPHADIAGSRPFRQFRRALTPKATVVVIGAKFPSNRGIGPLSHIIGTRLASVGKSQTVKFFVAQINAEDLGFLGELLEAGKVRSVIDRRFELSEAADALRYLGEGHARGKVIITV